MNKQYIPQIKRLILYSNIVLYLLVTVKLAPQIYEVYAMDGLPMGIKMCPPIETRSITTTSKTLALRPVKVGIIRIPLPQIVGRTTYTEIDIVPLDCIEKE